MIQHRYLYPDNEENSMAVWISATIYNQKDPQKLCACLFNYRQICLNCIQAQENKSKGKAANYVSGGRAVLTDICKQDVFNEKIVF